MKWAVTILSTLLFIVVAVVGLLLIAFGARRLRRAAAVRAFRRQYGAGGKDLLIVLTDSPHWRPYIEREWLSRWGERTVVLNRSKPWNRKQPEARVWEAVKGEEEHTPLAVVIPARGKLKVIRLFLAFRDYKHGRDRKLRTAEAELEAALST